ncbi:MAG: hypothetical protein QXL24_02135, partial [Candidatus Jordarchaeaceae archaeon]
MMKIKAICFGFLISLFWFSLVFSLGGTGTDGSFDLSLGSNSGGCNGPGMTWYDFYTYENYKLNYLEGELRINNEYIPASNREAWSGPTCVIDTDVKDTFNFTNVNIPSGKYLRAVGSKALRIYSTRDILISGVISVSGHLTFMTFSSPSPVPSYYLGAGGHGASDGPGSGTDYISNVMDGAASGGGFGGAGARGSNNSYPGGQPYISEDRGGSGGGNFYWTRGNRTYYGGGGGGFVYLEANGSLILNSGKIYANGGSGGMNKAGGAYSGGGSGGQIKLTVRNLAIYGSSFISAGGGGSTSSSYSAGGGGRITINYISREGTSPSDIINVSSGGGGGSPQFGVITISQLPAVNILNISCSQSLYEGQSGSCVAQVEAGGNVVYEWSLLDGGSFIGDTSGSSVTVRFSQSGDKRVKLRVYPLSEPDNFDEEVVTVSVLKNNINLILDAPLLMALDGSELVNLVSASSSYGNLRYIWEVEGGTFQEVSPPSQGSLRTIRVYPSQVGPMVVRLRGELEEDSNVYNEVSKEIEVRQ